MTRARSWAISFQIRISAASDASRRLVCPVLVVVSSSRAHSKMRRASRIPSARGVGSLSASRPSANSTVGDLLPVQLVTGLVGAPSPVVEPQRVERDHRTGQPASLHRLGLRQSRFDDQQHHHGQRGHDDHREHAGDEAEPAAHRQSTSSIAGSRRGSASHSTRRAQIRSDGVLTCAVWLIQKALPLPRSECHDRGMPATLGFNHVATVTPDLDRLVRFYVEAFGAEKSFEMAATDDHPRMAIIELGGGAAMNIFEAPEESIIGDRRTMGGRGAIDHFGLAVDSLATLEGLRDRMVSAGAEIGEIQRLGDTWSLFFRDPDGMELEVCCAGQPGDELPPS